MIIPYLYRVVPVQKVRLNPTDFQNTVKIIENITLNAKPKVFDWISNFPKKYHEKVDKQIGSSDEFPPSKVNRNKSTDWLEPSNVPWK